MDKSVNLHQSVKITIVLLELIGMDSFVLVMLTFAHRELSGLEVIVKQLKKNASQACIGLVVLALLFHVSVLISSFGIILKVDAFQLTMFAQVGHIIMDTPVHHIANVKTIKSGVILWLNVFALITHFGMVTHA